MIDQSRAIDNRRFVRALRLLPPSFLREVEEKLRLWPISSSGRHPRKSLKAVSGKPAELTGLCVS